MNSSDASLAGGHVFIPALTLTLLFAAAVEENAEFKQGSQAYQNLEFEQALFRFQRLAVAPGLDDKDRAKVLVWVGLSYAGMGDEPSAKQAIADAVNFDDDVGLPSFAPPKVKEWMADVRIEKARAKSANKAPPPTATTGAGSRTTAPPDDSPTTPETATSPDATPDKPKPNPYAGTSDDSAEMGEIELPPETSAAPSGPNYVLIGTGGALVLVGVVSAVGAAVFLYDYAVVIPERVAERRQIGDDQAVAEAELYGTIDLVSAVVLGGVAVGGILTGAGLAAFGLIE